MITTARYRRIHRAAAASGASLIAAILAAGALGAGLLATGTLPDLWRDGFGARIVRR